MIISNNPGSKSSDIATKLSIPTPSVKRILVDLLEKELIEKYGVGKGTNYSIK
jgi:DNA-binding MarR family transcriptional regulator